MNINAEQLTMILACNALLSVAVGFFIAEARNERIKRLECRCSELSESLRQVRKDLSRFMMSVVAALNADGVNVSEAEQNK